MSLPSVKPFLQCLRKGSFFWSPLPVTGTSGEPVSPTAHHDDALLDVLMQQGTGTAAILWLHGDAC